MLKTEYFWKCDNCGKEHPARYSSPPPYLPISWGQYIGEHGNSFEVCDAIKCQAWLAKLNDYVNGKWK